MNKAKRLGSLYDLYTGWHIEGKAKGKAFRCFKCGSKTDGNVCKICEPFKYNSPTLINEGSSA